jgi:hypothetical protein
MFIDIPGKVSTTFYEGGAVTDDGGNGEADVLTASEGFIGFVERSVITNATTSDINVKIRTQGILKDVPVTGLTADTNYGVAVYMSDNGTFTLTSTTTFVQIGKVVRPTAALRLRRRVLPGRRSSARSNRATDGDRAANYRKAAPHRLPRSFSNAVTPKRTVFLTQK